MDLSTICPPLRKRSACGPEYLGPANRSVTRMTGHWVSQIVHLTHESRLARSAASPLRAKTSSSSTPRAHQR